MSFLLLMNSPSLTDLVRAMFAANEQGIWLDPSDFSTLYQDSAGTTPVTAVGQPVGLALDKRLGLALGSEKIANGAIAITGSATAATYNSTTGVGSVTRVDASNQSYVTFTALATNNHRITITNTGATDLFIRAGTAIGAVSYIVTAGATLTARLFTTSGAFAVTGNTGTVTFVVNSVREIAGNHASQATAASRPTLQQDSSGLYYLSFDGTDDGMLTPSIDFTGTDKMTVWAGVRKLSDAAGGMVFELSAASSTNNGSFNLQAPRSATASYCLSTKGTGFNSGDYSTFSAPISTVISAAMTTAGSTVGNTITGRFNGTVNAGVANSNAATTGNYGNYPLYIGRRGGASLPFNGRLYGLIIRGAQSTAAQIAQTERYLNGQMGGIY